MKNFIPFVDKILRFFFGSKQERDLQQLQPMVELINLFERTVHDRPDSWFTGRTNKFRRLINEEFSPEERADYYRSVLTETQQKINQLDIDKVAEDFASRLLANREELLEKYKEDAFRGAIEAPLKPANIEKLKRNYRKRIDSWQQQSPEELEQQFSRLWDHFYSEAPEDKIQKKLWFLIPEAFAMVREIAHRRLGLRHYDVQVLGGIALHEGRITEMKTGEGKTLAATMPLYLNSLLERGCHLVTVNNYLARRDARWMGEIYEKLGVSVGLIQEGMKPGDRKPEYTQDITYGTNNEIGFDYLRDNMAVDPEDIVQPEHYYAIIDEVDSVLIDEARTPLIISGQADKPVSLYRKLDGVARSLQENKDYEIDEKKHSVSLLDEGTDKVEEKLDLDNLFSTANMELVHHIHQSIRAHKLYERDSEYVVKDGQVIIVDEFTGRLQPGRRFSEGLHQAIEAKEGVEIEQENKTLATITIQNFFRMYDKLAGMTGTADTEAEEFQEIYDLDVVVVPTNDPDIRVDKDDAIYRTQEEKYRAVINEIEHLHEHGQPVLVGTIDIETSELLGRMLAEKGIDHEILNAKNHEKEAAIIARAGQAGAVTIATNMAGRGTDIVLGEDVIKEDCPIQPEEDPEADPYCPHDPNCGLHVLGTERHEARRIDNQLRGRTARQGDPGASQFFVSLEDDLMRLFGSDRISGILQKLGLEEGQRIEHPWISKSIKRAQSKVESHNFEIRKQLLEYDNVLDRQRKIIYNERTKALKESDVSGTVERFINAQVEEWLEYHAVDRRPAIDWPLEELLDDVESLIDWQPNEEKAERWQKKRREEIKDLLLEEIHGLYQQREEELGEEIIRDMEKQLLLQVIDTHWKDHLHAMDSLKQGIHLEGMAQKDPLVEYKRQGFEMFETLQTRIREDLLRFLFQVEVVAEMPGLESPEVTEFKHDEFQQMGDLLEDETAEAQQEAVRSGKSGGSSDESTRGTVVKEKDVGRNDPCPCGSGKKYKYCCDQD